MLNTNFEQCAIASGLVPRESLESVWREMNAQGDDIQPEEIPMRLSEILVHRQILNPWQAQQLLAGRSRFTLGLYRILDSIGQGGMGQVYKARHTVLNRVVAIKVLPLHKSTPAAIENFQNEIQALASLDHPNLVKAIDAGKDGNVYYLVCEYVPGPDLRKHVRRQGQLSEEIAASIFVQVAAGLQHAHSAGLVHRDVKPGNILLSMDGIAKLSDLGLASPRRDENDSDPKQMKIVGTADYISPDHLESPGNPEPVWDIYSLGCSLYYAVTGKVPYPGGTAAEKVNSHRDPKMFPLDPQRLNPVLSNEFVAVLGDMMAKKPEDRIPSAEEVIRQLRPWSDGTPRPLVIVDDESSLSLSVSQSESQGVFIPTPPVPPQDTPSGKPGEKTSPAAPLPTVYQPILKSTRPADPIPPAAEMPVSFFSSAPPVHPPDSPDFSAFSHLGKTPYPYPPPLPRMGKMESREPQAEEEKLSNEDMKRLLKKFLIFFVVIPGVLILAILFLYGMAK